MDQITEWIPLINVLIIPALKMLRNIEQKQIKQDNEIQNIWNKIKDIEIKLNNLNKG